MHIPHPLGRERQRIDPAGTVPAKAPTRRPSPQIDHRTVRKGPVRRAETMRELTEAWLAAEANSLSLTSYRSFVKTHVLSWAADLPPEAMTVMEIGAWCRARAADGYHKATIQTLGSFWAKLVRFGNIPFDVAGLGLQRRTQVSSRADQALTLAEMALLVRSKRCPLFIRAWCVALLLTGLRVGELIGACWRDLDRSAPGLPRLTLPQAWRTKDRAMGPTKDGATRIIPVHRELVALIDEIETVYYRGRQRGCDPLFPFLPGRWEQTQLKHLRRWNQRTALRKWHLFLGEHGLAPRTEHATRHSFVSALTTCKADPVAAHSITHPGSLAPALGEHRGSFGRYVHVEWMSRVAAIEALRLPAVSLATDSQLSLGLGGPAE